MMTNSFEPDSGETAATGRTRRNPKVQESLDTMRALREEMRTQQAKGAEPWKLRHLQRQLDEQRVRWIDEVLALDDDDIMLRLLQQRAACMRLIEMCEQASLRPDLTRREVMYLARIEQRNREFIIRGLEMEKALLQSRRRPGAHPGH